MYLSFLIYFISVTEILNFCSNMHIGINNHKMLTESRYLTFSYLLVRTYMYSQKLKISRSIIQLNVNLQNTAFGRNQP